MNWRAILRGLPILLTLAGIGLLVEYTQLGDMLDQRWIDNEVRGKGLQGELLFLGIGAMATAVGLPRQIVAFMAGYAFGFLQGTLLALVAAVGGCIVAFYYARLFGRSLVATRFSGRVRRLDNFIRDNPFTMTLLIRLLPAGNNLVTSLAGGVSSAAAAPFIAGSAVGYLPQTLVFALVGSGVSVDPGWRIAVGVALFIVSGALGIYLYRRLRHGRTYDETLDK